MRKHITVSKLGFAVLSLLLFLTNIRAEENTVENRKMTIDPYPSAEQKSLRMTVQNPSEKIKVALIDTGVNNMATRNICFVEESSEDENGHGTKMAQCLQLASKNRIELWSLKAFDKNGEADLTAVYQALSYAIKNQADMILLSAGMDETEHTDFLKEKIQEATAQGIVFICSAGSGNKDTDSVFPACMKEATVVSSCDDNAFLTSGANTGSSVDYYVVSSSTSEAAALFCGYLAADDIKHNVSIIYEINTKEDRRQKYDLDKDTIHFHINESCYTAPGCLVTRQREGEFNGHYVTWFRAPDCSFLCFEENVPFISGLRYILTYDQKLPAETKLLAAYAYSQGSDNSDVFVEAQLALWGYNREQVLKKAEKWAEDLVGEALEYTPSFSGPDHLEIGKYQFFETDDGFEKYDYRISNLSVEGEGAKSEDVLVTTSGTRILLYVNPEAEDYPTAVSFSLRSNRESKPGSYHPEGYLARPYDASQRSQGLLACGSIQVTPKEIYHDVSIRLEIDPSISTEAVNPNTGNKVLPISSSCVIEDKISSFGLLSGTYKVVTSLVDPVSEEILMDKNGKKIEQETVLELSGGKETFSVFLNFDSRGMEGKKAVVFESVYDLHDQRIIDHKDTKDCSQAVYFPAINTMAENEKKEKELYDTEILTDTIAYFNLEKGKSYHVKSSLWDNNSCIYEQEEDWIAEEKDGNWDICFYGVRKNEKEKNKLVVFEEIYDGDSLIISHCDNTDTDQTVVLYHPSYSTEVSNKRIVRTMSDICIRDQLQFSGIIEGSSLCLKVWVIHVQTGKTVTFKDGDSEKEYDFIYDSDTNYEIELELNSATMLPGYYVICSELTIDDEIGLSDTDIHNSKERFLLFHIPDTSDRKEIK